MHLYLLAFCKILMIVHTAKPLLRGMPYLYNTSTYTRNCVPVLPVPATALIAMAGKGTKAVDHKLVEVYELDMLARSYPMNRLIWCFY